MRVVGVDGTAADDCCVDIGNSAGDGDTGLEAQAFGRSGQQVALDRTGGDQFRQQVALTPGTSHEIVDVRRLGSDVVVGQPGGGHRCGVAAALPVSRKAT